MTDPNDDLDRRLTDYAARWQAAVPAPIGIPDTDALAPAPRKRRRTTLLVAAAVLVAVAVPVTLLRDGAEPGPEPAPVVEPSSLDCSPVADTEVTGDPAVPGGAIAARFCGGQADNGGIDRLLRDDVLTAARTTELVDRLNTMTPFVQQQPCRLIGGASYGLVLLYPDGSRVRLNGYTGGCPTLEVEGGAVWSEAADILQVTQRLINEQRAAEPPPAEAAPAARCPEIWNDVYETADAEDVQAGQPMAITACRYKLDLSDRTIISQSAPGVLVDSVSPKDPARLFELVGQGGGADPCRGVAYNLDATQDVLLVRDRYGDTHVVPTAPCWPSRLMGSTRYPSPTLALEVRRLFPGASDPATNSCETGRPSGFRVTLSIFSGNPNPEWTLSTAEAELLRAALREDPVGVVRNEDYPDQPDSIPYLVEAEGNAADFLRGLGLPDLVWVFADLDRTDKHVNSTPVSELLGATYRCRTDRGLLDKVVS